VPQCLHNLKAEQQDNKNKTNKAARRETERGGKEGTDRQRKSSTGREEIHEQL
jgi:hypothetical protein